MTDRDASPRSQTPPSSSIRRWRRYLANERAEAAVYRDLAGRRAGEEREILLALASAESRHEQHWVSLLGNDVGQPQRGDLRTRVIGFLARRFGSVFVLALAQRREARSPYESDADATHAMAADEQIHEEVVRGLAIRGRNRLSGTFRAAVFGANDGLVSNLSLVVGMSASGVSHRIVTLTGFAGLLAGALSMGAGEYVSVRSQRELLEASTPDPKTDDVLKYLDVDANELALVYRARGMSAGEAVDRARETLGSLTARGESSEAATPDDHEAVGTGLGAAISSFTFFASGAILPVLPFLVGLSGAPAVTAAAIIVGFALLGTGTVVGLLTGGRPFLCAWRQLAIGFGAASVTYALGLLFGTAAA
ncbi:MAG: VIT1/CCC1 transporter family protein [Aeromicrobium sp.]